MAAGWQRVDPGQRRARAAGHALWRRRRTQSARLSSAEARRRRWRGARRGGTCPRGVAGGGLRRGGPGESEPRTVASIDLKAAEPAIHALGLTARFFPAARLNQEEQHLTVRSELVR